MHVSRRADDRQSPRHHTIRALTGVFWHALRSDTVKRSTWCGALPLAEWSPLARGRHSNAHTRYDPLQPCEGLGSVGQLGNSTNNRPPILGGTELSLLLPQDGYRSIPSLDPTRRLVGAVVARLLAQQLPAQAGGCGTRRFQGSCRGSQPSAVWVKLRPMAKYLYYPGHADARQRRDPTV